MAWWDKVQPGDKLRIPAAAWNALLDMLNDRSNFGTGAGGRKAGVVKIKNATGSDVPRFGILGVSGVAPSPSDNLAAFLDELALIGSLPQPGSPFAITLAPIASGAIGPSTISGPVPVRLYASAQYPNAGWAEPVANDTLAMRIQPGGTMRILWRSTVAQNGIVWAVADYQPNLSPIVRFSLITTLSPGGSAQAYVRDPNGPTSQVITVYDTIGAFSGYPGAVGIAMWFIDSQKFEVIQLSC